jgi:hypothetical protein
MVYYDRLLTLETGLAQAYIRDVPGSGEDTLARPTQEVLGLYADECAASAAQGKPRIWFVIFRQQIAQSGGASPDQQWFEAHYRRSRDLQFNDLLVFVYDQPDEIARQGRCGS